MYQIKTLHKYEKELKLTPAEMAKFKEIPVEHKPIANQCFFPKGMIKKGSGMKNRREAFIILWIHPF